MIRFVCPQCGKINRVADQHGGKRGRCPGCHQTFLIPPPQAPVEADGQAGQATSEASQGQQPDDGRRGKLDRRLVMAAAGVGVVLLLGVAGSVGWMAGRGWDTDEPGRGSAANSGPIAPAAVAVLPERKPSDGAVATTGSASATRPGSAAQDGTDVAGEEPAAKLDLPLLANGLIDPQGCQIVMTVLGEARIGGEVVAISPNAQRLVYVRNPNPAKTTQLSLWSPPAAPEDQPTQLAMDAISTNSGTHPTTLTFSPDSKHIAYVGAIDKDVPAGRGASPNHTIVLDGVSSGSYYDVNILEFSPNSRRLAAIVKTSPVSVGDSKWAMVVDGKPGKEYAYVFYRQNQMQNGSLRLLQPGQAMRGSAARNGSWCGIFSPDSKRVAYPAQVGRGAAVKWLLVVDDKETSAFGKPETNFSIRATWSPDGRHIVHTASNPDGMALMLDGQKTAEYPAIFERTFRFSADSQTLAFQASRFADRARGETFTGTRPCIVCGDKSGRTYAHIDAETLHISPQGTPRYAAALNGYRDDIKYVVDGDAETVVLSAKFVISPNAEHVASFIRPGPKSSPLPESMPEGDWVDGKVPMLAMSGTIGDFMFSPDGRHFARYAALSWASPTSPKSVAVDNLQGPEFTGQIVAMSYDAPDRLVIMTKDFDTYRVLEFKVAKK